MQGAKGGDFGFVFGFVELRGEIRIAPGGAADGAVAQPTKRAAIRRLLPLESMAMIFKRLFSSSTQRIGLGVLSDMGWLRVRGQRAVRQ